MELLESVGNKLKEKIENSDAISVFVKHRSKFEGWLKVEVVNILIDLGIKKIIPEWQNFDVVFKFEEERIGVELKTINTNYRITGVEEKTRPITMNIQNLLDDIHNLKIENTFSKRFVIFVVFPLPENKKEWEYHINKIKNNLSKELKEWKINFKSDIPGRLYIGEV